MLDKVKREVFVINKSKYQYIASFPEIDSYSSIASKDDQVEHLINS